MRSNSQSRPCLGANSASPRPSVERRGTVGPAWMTLGGTRKVIEISAWREAIGRAIHAGLAHGSRAGRRFWLEFLCLALSGLLLGAFMAPLSTAFGWRTLGMRIFATYHVVCAQIPSHSYFVLGHQVALCARNLAIFGSLLVGSLAFHSVRDWLPPLNWRLWVATMLPMAWDGGSQLFGWRESTWELRTLTGVIFGLGICWFALPTIQRAVSGVTPPSGR